MAICAICERPMHDRREIGIFGSEAAHKTCVRTIGASNSLLERTRRKLMQAENDALRDRNHSNARIMELGAENRELRADDRRIREQLDDMRTRVRMLELQLSAKNADLADMAVQLREEQNRTDAAIRERDAARSEAALYRTIGLTPASTGSSQPVDTRDATEVRFSLLELDKD